MRRSAACSIGLALAATAFAGFARAQIVGKPAPNFHATILDGGKVSLADFKG